MRVICRMKIYLIIYGEDGTIEGYVRDKEDFNKWLSLHNHERMKMNGAEPEKDFEFVIKEIGELSF